MNLNPSMSQSWSEGGIQLLGKTLPEENFAQVKRLKETMSDSVCLIISIKDQNIHLPYLY